MLIFFCHELRCLGQVPICVSKPLAYMEDRGVTCVPIEPYTPFGLAGRCVACGGLLAPRLMLVSLVFAAFFSPPFFSCDPSQCSEPTTSRTGALFFNIYRPIQTNVDFSCD